MRKKSYKTIRRRIIVGGNFIISVLLLLNIKNNPDYNINIYRYNLLCILLFITLNLFNIFIIKLKDFKGGVK